MDFAAAFYFCGMKQNKIIQGIIAGAVVIGYALLLYTTQKTNLFTTWFYFSSLLIYAFFMYRAAKSVAHLEFRAVLQGTFVVFLIANALWYVFDYTLYNVFDKTLAQVQADAAINYYKAAGVTGEELEKTADIIRQSDIHNIKSLATGFAKGAIGGFGLAVALTALVKRHSE
jgi:hypothetical protein